MQTGIQLPRRVASTDEIFIRAPQRTIARALLDLSDDSTWWPGARVRGGYGWLEVDAPAGRLASRVTFRVRVGPVREWEGFAWTLERGELTGRAEWWFEAFKDGTLVHHYLDAVPAGRSLRPPSGRLRRYRLAVRAGLNGLKDSLEGR